MSEPTVKMKFSADKFLDGELHFEKGKTYEIAARSVQRWLIRGGEIVDEAQAKAYYGNQKAIHEAEVKRVLDRDATKEREEAERRAADEAHKKQEDNEKTRQGSEEGDGLDSEDESKVEDKTGQSAAAPKKSSKKTR